MILFVASINLVYIMHTLMGKATSTMCMMCQMTMTGEKKMLSHRSSSSNVASMLLHVQRYGLFVRYYTILIAINPEKNQAATKNNNVALLSIKTMNFNSKHHQFHVYINTRIYTTANSIRSMEIKMYFVC